MQRLRHGVLGKRRSGIARFQGKSEEHGVIGDRIKIEGCGHLNLIARGVLDRLPESKPVSIVGRCGGTKVVSIKRVLGMDMQIAKVRIAQRIRRRRRAVEHVHHRLERVTAATAKIVVLVD